MKKTLAMLVMAVMVMAAGTMVGCGPTEPDVTIDDPMEEPPGPMDVPEPEQPEMPEDMPEMPQMPEPQIDPPQMPEGDVGS